MVLNRDPFGIQIVGEVWQAQLKFMQDALEYSVDTWQKTFLFQDVLRKRGNEFIENRKQGNPPVLDFKYKIICDGRNLEQPVNYALARIFHREKHPHDPNTRPVVIIDPRAGHGPGIGGFKEESEVGIALKNRHPVYFIMFFANPVAGQTIDDVLDAEIEFLERVKEAHPDAGKPAVIGNCQAGWATALIAASRPDLTGPVMLNGAPLSYWAGNGLNTPLRIKGGLTGGNWMASLFSDFGNGRFDGAHLVSGFEDLNPANTLWKKPYHLFSNVDQEEKRYLGFERWWGGFFFMTKEEIRFITESLFIGNFLEQGKVQLNSGSIDLKNITDPVIVFASHGDNITSPQQALSWIPAVWESEDKIMDHKRIIIYLIHKNIGHLGIFVSGGVARKEHKELLAHMELFEQLTPGLYEMVISEKEKTDGSLDIRFEPRTIKDISRLNDDSGQKAFEVVNWVSQLNDQWYHICLSPFIRRFINEYTAAFIRKQHPLRLERSLWSDLNPALIPVKTMSTFVRKERKPASEDNPFSMIEQHLSNCIGIQLDYYRNQRDLFSSTLFFTLYGNPMAIAWYDFFHSTVEEKQR